MADFLWVDLVVLGAVLVGVLALALAGVSLMFLRKQASAHEEMQQRLQRELKVLQSSAVGMGKRLVQLEQQLVAGVPVAQAVPVPTPSSLVANDNLKDAVSLLSAGVSADEVARRCGISRAEASLMKLMRSQVHRSAA